MRVPAALTAVVVALSPFAAQQRPLAAQQRPPAEGGRTVSLGQPAAWKGTAAVGVEAGHGGSGVVAVGLQRDVLNPMLSLLAVHGEAYIDAGQGGVDAGVRTRLMSPVGRLGFGADVSATQGRADFLLSAFHPVRRGGVFRDGSLLRVDYVPARDAVMVAVEKPVRRNSLMGASRPRSDRVRLPPAPSQRSRNAPPAAAAPALAEAAVAADEVRRSVLPLGQMRPGSGADAARRELEPLLRTRQQHRAARPSANTNGAPHPDADAAVLRYHAAVDRAFSAAVSAVSAVSADAGEVTSLGRAVSAGAREILLEDVLVPYNRLLGQVKRNDSMRGFGPAARARFVRWLHLHSGAAAEDHDAALAVFDELVEMLEAVRVASLAQWGDSRFVWLPLQLALRPEQHDTQEQLDALVELATGARFTDGNLVSWVVNEQFQYQLSRTIRAARDYHVLWTHDFRGLDATLEPDEMAFRHVLRSYYAALTERVREYDRTGRFPTYIIVLDQWFYEVNRGRLWMTLLEDPLGHMIRLPANYSAWEDSLAVARRELNTAIASSALLQAQTGLYGEAWLRNLIKVHVNITNPADASFWSTRVLPLLPLPDNMMRDHRKVVFYDLTEEDPYSGEAMFTGAGIGEHYANLSWEDRSLLVRGPAALPLKAAARELLIAQGISAARVPYALQPRPRAPDYDERVRDAAQRNQHTLRATQMHHGAGFSEKHVNVAKAVLYTLMPAGSVIKIPDSLWNSDFWASVVLGCAARGVRVLVIAPAGANAPADAFGTLGRSRELLTRLLHAREALAYEIETAGGLLALGLYASDLQVTDIPAKIALVHTAFTEQAWLRSLFGFSPRVLAGLQELTALFDSDAISMAPDARREFEYDPRPKLHLKANFFASAEAWTLMGSDGWSDASWQYMMVRVNQVQERSAAVESFAEYPDALAPVGGGMVGEWYESLDEDRRRRVIFYTLTGSHNQNSRSMVIDAEVGFLIAHWPAIIPYIDLVTIIGQTHWIDSPAQLDGMLPLDTGFRRRMANWARLAL